MNIFIQQLTFPYMPKVKKMVYHRLSKFFAFFGAFDPHPLGNLGVPV